MANRIKLKGTSETSFDIGLGPKQTFDASGLTANRTWALPDSNGTNGYVLSTDGSGNLDWVAQSGSISSQARLQFTAATNGTGQTFTDVGLATFTNNTYANVFVNGVLLQTSEYSISSTTLTVSRYLSTGDNVIVGPTAAGGTPTGAQGTSWTAAGSIAVGDIFTGTISDYVNAGSTYTASTTINDAFKTWIPVDAPRASSITNKIIWDGTQYVAVGNGSILTSPNGYNWTQVLFNASYSTNRNFVNIAYGAGIYVAAATDEYLYTSTDLVTWTQRTRIGYGGSGSTGLIFANGVFVASAIDNSGPPYFVIYSSTNGTSWTLRDSTLFLTDIIYDGSKYVGCGQYYDGVDTFNSIATSTDAITWTRRYTSTANPNDRFYSIAWNGSNNYVVVGGRNTSTADLDETTIAYSSDALSWTVSNSVVNYYYKDNAFVGSAGTGKYIVLGSYIYISGPPGPPAVNLPIQLFSTTDGTAVTRKGINYYYGRTPEQNVAYSEANYVDYVNGKLFMNVNSNLYVGIPDNQIYVGSNLSTAPAGTYRCLGSADKNSPTYLWVRLT